MDVLRCVVGRSKMTGLRQVSGGGFMLKLVNEISELVYVADLDTYELVFLNESGKQFFGAADKAGKKCYEILQGRSQPCEFCINDVLLAGKEYKWKCQNPVTGRYYYLKDKLIEWNGRKAKLEIALDVTEQEEQSNEIKRALDREILIVDCIKSLHENMDLGVGLQAVIQKIGRFLLAGRVYIFQLKKDVLSNTYEWCADGVTPQKENLQNIELPRLKRWIKEFKTYGCVVVEDVEKLKRTHADEYELLRGQSIRTMVAVPLEHDGQFVGLIGADNPPLDKIQLISPLLSTLSYFIGSEIKKAETEEKLFTLSYFDILTEFYNRNKFTMDIPVLNQQQYEKAGLIYLDVNGLKKINDEYGHWRGDQILREAACNVKAVFSGYPLYRVGGDEMVVICPLIEFDKFRENIMDLKSSFQRDRNCTAAIGAVWREGKIDFHEMIVEADAKMYEDKKNFYREHAMSGRYRHYNDDVLGLTEAGALQRAIDAGYFFVYLQPKVAFHDQRIVGAEALVRYQDLENGFVPPDQFISLLESAGMVSHIDFYVFESVLKLLMHWREKGLPLYPVSVNFSRCTIVESNFIQKLNAIWKKYGLPHGLVELEITERAQSEDSEHVLIRIKQLKHCGFSVSIDDFGVKYANLSLFTAADIDIVKLDKSLLKNFYENSKSYFVISSVVQLCRKLGVKTIMEGVETKGEFTLLKQIGCDHAQGYFFSRPLPIEQYEKNYLQKFS